MPDTATTTAPRPLHETHPVQLTTTVAVDLHIDLAGLVADHLNEYHNVDLYEYGYDHEWERPLAFLAEFMANRLWLDVGGGARVREGSTHGDIDWMGWPRQPWSEDDYATLLEQVPAARRGEDGGHPNPQARPYDVALPGMAADDA